MLNRWHTIAGAIALVALATSLSACHIMLISDYDETFDQEATNAQKDVDALMQKIINNPSTTQSEFTAESFASDKDAYAKIDNELDAMLVRAQAHQHNEGTIGSVQKVAHSFSLIESEHKTKTSVHIQQVRDELMLMNHEFTALIAEELLKKQGKN
jgi:hypothetical protein